MNFMPMVDTTKEINKASAAYGSSLSGRLGIAISFLCSLFTSYLHFPQNINVEIWVHLGLSYIVIVAFEMTKKVIYVH